MENTGLCWYGYGSFWSWNGWTGYVIWSKYFDSNGNMIVDDGFKTFAQKMVDWHAEGLMPAIYLASCFRI